jgi:5,10-methylenetetrahydromethanopterin reductase
VNKTVKEDVMLIGVNAVPDVSHIELAVLAEQLGYDGFYVGDNPLMWSDPYVALAEAARRTERIRIGSLVSVAGVRSAVVTAGAIATINWLAPGRVSCGVGTGNTARRLMGKRPLTLESFERWVGDLRRLLDGQEIELESGPRRARVRHMAPDHGFVAFEPKIPVYLSGFGPRSIALAGKCGDGLVGGAGTDPESARIAWQHLRAGAGNRVGRELVIGEFYVASVTSMCVLRDDEAIDSPRVIDEAGAVAMSALHLAYEQHVQMGSPPPPFAENIWDEYVQMIERIPPESRHARVHEGTSTWLVEEDRRFITPELLDATSMIGKPADLADRIRVLDETGLVSELIIAPPADVAAKVITDVAEQVIPLLK